MVDQESRLSSANLAYVEALYREYLRSPQAVDPHWRSFFENWREPEASAGAPRFRRRSIFNPGGNGRARSNGHAAAAPAGEAATDASLQHRVDQLIRNYRVRGHIVANVDPLGHSNESPPELDLSYYGFTEADMDRPFHTSSMPGPNERTLRQIVAQLRNTYCGDVGVQFMHIDNLRVREWLQQRMEGSENQVQLSTREQVRILTRLTDAVIFEQFIQRKFTGAKSFSLEGAESLIPLMDMAFEKAGDQNISSIVIGMAHRGRLNVLANILGKSPQQIFREFEDRDPRQFRGRGDVKYHLGYSGDWRTRHGKNIHLSLCFNPSHLEYVNPVALGRMRAKQDRVGDTSHAEHGLVVLIHGDAAFAGEGVVQETLNLSSLDGYRIGGALHVIVNNQIGFTTGPREGRSSRYSTDVAKMLQIPIFHVNGESPEAVAQAISLAMDFRRQFKRDVVIDMYCYRRRGHNEGDEPSFTQPRMYSAIETRESVREGYLDYLLRLGGLTREDADRIVERRTQLLEKELSAARSETHAPRRLRRDGVWQDYHGGPEKQADDVPTGVDRQRLSELLDRMTRLPEDFHVHPKIKRLLRLHREMAAGDRKLDWATAETLAFATLTTEGYRLRMSGQDAQRGTFSHRHSVLTDVEDGHTYMPLQHLADDQAPVEIINSPLSEVGVLGFEYGYSLDWPDGLVVWEAQFGDFANAAQVIIDQFISSAEDKWRRLSGLVLLLPHGFEGQGPEHSSARLERFLMLAAEDNIQVVSPTTPAQYFHLLRRQVLRRWRKPLVVMSPKSLLRHPRVVAELDELAGGTFKRVLPDEGGADRRHVSRVLLCSGKIYYELLDQREKLGREDIAIVRLEQYYPFPAESLRAALARYPDGTPVFWVQEEPGNMGAWPMLRQKFCRSLFDRLPFDGIHRTASASPATGSRAAHQMEQDEILAEAFGGFDHREHC
ncbi:MAG: 2-oxoglutarate dehydrogenase E1 component [Phycisphaeraceae bacterium]